MRTKIIIIGPLPPPTGGMATSMEQILSLNLNGYKYIPLNTAKSKSIKSNMIFKILNVLYLYCKLIYLLIRNDVKIAHIHTASYGNYWQNSGYILISRIFKIKIIMHMHGGDFENFYNKKRRQYLIKYFLNSCNAIIALSNRWKTTYSKITTTKIYVLSNMISLNDIKPFKKNFDDDLKVLFMGQISMKKGAYDLLDVIKMLKHKNIKFIFMGPYEDKAKFLSIIAKNNIQDNCDILGELYGRKKSKYLQKAHILILPSYIEGLPYAILEAMSYGLAIISTNVGAIPEIVNKKSGFLVKPGDKHNISKLIKNLNRNRTILKNMSIYNMKKIRNDYNINNYNYGLISIYGAL